MNEANEGRREKELPTPFFDGEGLVSIFMRDRKDPTPETPSRAAGRLLWENRHRGVLDPKRARAALQREARRIGALAPQYATLCVVDRMLAELERRPKLRSAYG